MAAISLHSLTKTYDNGFVAVRSIDLIIRDREFMVLVGPSGCGKTTTLRMIAGLEDISAGTITIADRVVNQVEPKDRDIAMVFQSYALYPHMTVFENLAFGLRLRKVATEEITRTVTATANLLNLSPHLNSLPRQLSGGQRQRVAVGRAIVRQPAVFLFDEPLSNLDAKLRGDMRAELKRLQRQLTTTTVYVTHDQIEAMTLGDRITVMSQGSIQQVATPVTLYHWPFNRFVAEFIGTPPMNFLPCTLECIPGQDHAVLADGARIPLHCPHRETLAERQGGAVILGIRPEHLAHAGHTPITATTVVVNWDVVLVELMGDLQYVYLKAPGCEQSVIMKCSSQHRAEIGERLPIRIDTSAAHVFADGTLHAQNLTLPPGFAQQQ